MMHAQSNCACQIRRLWQQRSTNVHLKLYSTAVQFGAYQKIFEMLQLSNLTSFESERALLSGLNATHVFTVVLKATYDIAENGDVTPADLQEPVSLSAVPSVEGTASTLVREVELTLDHPGTDVIVNGSVHAPNARPVSHLDAAMDINGVRIQFRCHGDRVWEKRGWSVLPSAPEPFAKMPLIYERAFGGGHAADASQTGAVEDPRNPIGKGYCTDPSRVIGAPVPNFESAQTPLSEAKANKIFPVIGLAARPAEWEPRRSYGGTYDDAWMKSRMPHWPSDVDPRFFRVAAPALQFPNPLVGHERVVLHNMSRSGQLAFKLPRVIPIVRTTMAGRIIPQEVNLRRVIIEPDLGKLVMLWRSTLDCGADGRHVEKTVVDLRPMRRATPAVAV
ncbi:MAG: DUF2169 domain-containing protein [Pseudomonadota bacterium]